MEDKMSDVILAWGGGSEECHSQETIDYMKSLGFSEFHFVGQSLDPRPDILARLKANGIFPVFNIEWLWINTGMQPADISGYIPQLKAIMAAGWKGFASEGLFGPQVEIIRQIGPYMNEGGEWGENLIGGYYGHWRGQHTANYMECYHSSAIEAMHSTMLVNNVDTPQEMGLTYMMYPQTADLEMAPDSMRQQIIEWSEAQGVKLRVYLFWMGFEGCPKTKLQDGTFVPLLNMITGRSNIVKRLGWNQTSTAGLTKINIFPTKHDPAINEPFTVYGFLQTSDGKFINDKPVDLWVRIEGAEHGTLLQTVTTDAKGMWKYEVASDQPINLRVLFRGDASFKSAQSDLLLIKPLRPATLTLDCGTPTPKIGETYFFYGLLTDAQTKEPMINAAVNIWVRHANEKVGRFWKTMLTDKDGKYLTPAVSIAPVFVRTVFMSGTVHTTTYSNLVEVNPK
jgi:hypothetical protein